MNLCKQILFGASFIIKHLILWYLCETGSFVFFLIQPLWENLYNGTGHHNGRQVQQ